MSSTRPSRDGRGVRHTTGGEHDRLKRAVLQPVQCWDKKWADSKNGRNLQVFKWVKSDRQVDFDDDDEDDEAEQTSAARPAGEEEAPASSTMDETAASTPAVIGEDEDEEEAANDDTKKPDSSAQKEEQHKPESPVKAKAEVALPNAGQEDKTPSTIKQTKVQQLQEEESVENDDDRPLVFTPSLETPVETEANTPQDFESMSPVPTRADEITREVEAELVVEELDRGQAEMEEEMEEKVVEQEKKNPHHPRPTANGQESTMDIDSTPASDAAGGETPSVDSAMDIDEPSKAT
ncbi:hypothetical protein BGW42_000416 [Actinomortierella wolfii]|nr:hypothetical protein BGW42_000416 [Actinomortierella wolfii]